MRHFLDRMIENPFATYLMFLLLTIGFFLLIRAITLWYFQIDKIVSLLSEIRDRLPSTSHLVDDPVNKCVDEKTNFDSHSERKNS